jgi:predicted O-linked N-acetylglucosamine transferase (SPINDLY family)
MSTLLDRDVSISTIRAIQSSEFYESAILADETIASNYWYLGISYLLIGNEEEAQAAWFIPFSAANPAEADILTDELTTILDREADTLVQATDFERAWLLRQHLWMIVPDRLENILKLIVLVHKLDRLTSEVLIEWQVNNLLETVIANNLDEDLLERVLDALMNLHTELSIEIIRNCLGLVKVKQDFIIAKITANAFKLFHQDNIKPFAVKLLEACELVKPDNLVTPPVLVDFYLTIWAYDKARNTAEKSYEHATNLIERLVGIYSIQKVAFTSVSWDNIIGNIDLHHQLLTETIHASPQGLSYWQNQFVLVSSFFLPYIEDNPQINKPIQNQIVKIFQQNILPKNVKLEIEELNLQKKAGCLRIGYVGSTLRAHSVGWLSRWLIHHHDREHFQIFIYNLNINKEDEFNHQWFRDKADITYYFEVHPQKVVAQIKADEVDILIDLDSLTFDTTCFVMACKPAPVQIAWLGWDSSGIPAIDYFIADPYVLPDNAQDYYQEQIWRLPQTYLAVDGFEIGIPTLRREDLNIPEHAVIYLSSQTGYKRHPDNIRCQMEIIKAVPNSYFLIQGKSDRETVQNFFGNLATEVGVDLDRLRFLDWDKDEYTHRANLAIADIVLDTFPYNGATTTLETLWMGIPMVTQVGQQFSARNSYTFMLNAGITEGIAWNQNEYIEWGIKLGLDRQLRDKIAGKLRSGQTTAPIWDAKQFTLEMEQAYQKMWAIYQEKISGI